MMSYTGLEIVNIMFCTAIHIIHIILITTTLIITVLIKHKILSVENIPNVTDQQHGF